MPSVSNNISNTTPAHARLTRTLIVLLVLVSALLSTKVVAQTFPVQTTIHLRPPYSPYLSDYIAPGSEKLFIQLLSNDVNIVDHPISFRVTIEGVGITIRTKQNFVPSQPLILFGGGAPTLLYGEDIAEYFNPNNLDFAGFSRKDFDKTGKLPEGIYRFTIEVLSYNRNVVISNKGTTIAWIILNDPPLLNLPRKDNKVRIIDPMNIAFTWTPRHTGSPNAAFTTEYIFRLVEIWPANRNPYDAFLSQLPLYEVTTDQTQIIYGPAEPALIPGRMYAWQVQAKDSESRDIFKNDGRSEVYVFQFGDAISPPENVLQDGAKATTINLTWDSPSYGEMPQSYRVRYKKRGAGENEWYESVTTQRWITLSDLQANTSYDVQVRSESKPQISEYSQRLGVDTGEETAAPYTCGLDVKIPLPANMTPLLTLKRGDVIISRSFKVYVSEAQGQAGTFSGKGAMPVPFLNMATVNVVFNGVTINSAYELIAGEILTTFNPGSEMGRAINDAQKIGEEPPKPTTDSATIVVPAITYTIDGTIDTVAIAANGDIIVTDEEGNETTYKQPVDPANQSKQPVLIADSAGNGYIVQTDPKTGQTTVTKAPAGAMAGGSSGNIQPDPVKDKIVVLILEELEKETAAWLRVNGKGGEDDRDVMQASSIINLFPGTVDVISHIVEHMLPVFKNDPKIPRADIEEDSESNGILNSISKPFKSADEVDLANVDSDSKELLRKRISRSLIDRDEDFEYERFSSSESPNITKRDISKYALYFAPSNNLFALPDFAVPLFERTTKKFKAPVGSLTGANIEGVIYYAFYFYNKAKGEWVFQEYRTDYEDPFYGSDLMSFMTVDAMIDAINDAAERADNDTSGGSSLATANTAVVGLVLGSALVQQLKLDVELAGYILSRTAQWTVFDISIAAKSTVVGAILGLILETFVVTTPSYYAYGPVVLDLPITTAMAAKWQLEDGIPKNLPLTAPVTIAHQKPKGNGKCSVYVIFRIDRLSGAFSISKYGMTCQQSSSGVQCDDRPNSQCQVFNTSPDPEYEAYRYWYKWTWLTPDVSSKTARIIEKSLTGAYILVNGGALPPQHQRPCFKYVPDVDPEVGDDFKKWATDERIRRVREWIAEMIKKYGAS